MKNSMLVTMARKSLLLAVITAMAAGAAGAAGPQKWSVYRGYDFAYARDDINDNDLKKAGQVAEYINRNPSLDVALDGSSTRRVHAVREALITAGVPPDKIQMGAYGDPNLRTDRHVAVLVGN